MPRKKTRFYPEGFYVYLHKKVSDDSVFYVGKGYGKRAWDWSKRTDLWKNIRRKHGLTVEVLSDGMSECCSHTLEKITIAKYRSLGMAQANLADGGEGTSGVKFSDEVKLKLSESHRNRYANEEERIKTSRASGGRALMCSNGMEFATGVHACEWVRSLGINCSGSNVILKCAHGDFGSAYGFAWWFKGDEAKEYIPPNVRSNASNSRAVYCDNGMKFQAASDALRWLNECGISAKSTSAIYHACNGLTETSYGYRWSYDSAQFAVTGKQKEEKNDK